MSKAVTFPAAGQIWKHYKGARYRIDDIGIDTASGDAVVIYHATSAAEADPVFVRQLGVFLGFTEDHQNRFTLIEGA